MRGEEKKVENKANKSIGKGNVECEIMRVK